MTVADLIAKLQELPDHDVEVLTFDADAGEVVPVSGMVYGGEDKIVILQTDEIWGRLINGRVF